MAVSDKQKNYAKKHQTEKLDNITIRPQKGTKDRWRAAAEAQGISMTQFVVDAVEAAINKTEE